MIDVLGNLSGIFSGILAFAFDTVSGSRGLSGWQWLFLVEGILTISFGLALPWILPDCKGYTSWRNPTLSNTYHSPTNCKMAHR